MLGGAMQIPCGNCGAPVEVRGGERMAACRYCGRANEVPAAGEPVRSGAPVPRVRPQHVALIVAGLGGVVGMAIAGIALTAPSAPTEAPLAAPGPASTQPVVPPEPVEAPRPRESRQMGACLVDRNGDAALDLAGLYTWTDDPERWVVSVIDGSTGDALFRGEELPEDTKVMCGRGGPFVFATPDFKLRFYAATAEEPVTLQLGETVRRYAPGDGCFAIQLENDEVVHYSYAGEALGACEGAPDMLPNSNHFGHASTSAPWVRSQDGVSYVVEAAERGTPMITVTAKRGDVSREVAAVERATAYFVSLLPREPGVTPFDARDGAAAALREALDGLEELWSVRLAIAGEHDAFTAVLTPSTLVVHGRDPAGGDEPYRLVGVGLANGSIRYTRELDRDVLALQYNGAHGLADARGDNYAFVPDTGEPLWSFGM